MRVNNWAFMRTFVTFSVLARPIAEPCVYEVTGIEIGKMHKTACSYQCLARPDCKAFSFIPVDGSTKPGTCVLDVPPGGVISHYANMQGWQRFMLHRTCSP